MFADDEYAPAAGVLFVHRDGNEPSVMLALRSEFVQEPGTWSTPGGTMHPGESPFEAALREATEEVGPLPIVGYVTHVEHDGYTTFVCEVPHRFGGPANWETEAVEWVPIRDVDGYDLHPGLVAVWPGLSRLGTTAVER